MARVPSGSWGDPDVSAETGRYHSGCIGIDGPSIRSVCGRFALFGPDSVVQIAVEFTQKYVTSWCVISDTRRIISRRRSTDAAHCQSSRNDLLQAKVHLVRAGSASSLGSIARGRDSLWEPCGRPGSVSGAGFGHRSQSRHSGRDCDARSSTLTNLTSQPDRASVRLNNSFGDVKPRRPVPTTNQYLKPDNVPAGRPTANWLPGEGEQAARNAFQGVGRRDDSRI